MSGLFRMLTGLPREYRNQVRRASCKPNVAPLLVVGEIPSHASELKKLTSWDRRPRALEYAARAGIVPSPLSSTDALHGATTGRSGCLDGSESTLLFGFALFAWFPPVLGTSGAVSPGPRATGWSLVSERTGNTKNIKHLRDRHYVDSSALYMRPEGIRAHLLLYPYQ